MKPSVTAMTRRSFVAGAAMAGAAMAGAGRTMAEAEEAPAGAAPEEAAGEAEELEADVVVVGAGPCGQAASISAAEAGASVIVVDRSTWCTGKHHVLAAWGTKLQEEAGFSLTEDEYVERIMRWKDDSCDFDEDLVRFTVEQMAPTYEWMEEHGVEWGRACAISGEPYEALTCVATKYGRDTVSGYTAPMEAAALAAGVQFLYETEAEQLLLDDGGVVCGVQCAAKDGHEVSIRAKSVVLAAGGYGGDPELLRKCAAWIPNWGPVSVEENSQWDLGDGWGIRQGMALGADLCVRGGGGVIYKNMEGANTDLAGQALHVGSDGRRFGDESTTRYARSRLACNAGNGDAWIIYDSKLASQLYSTASSSAGAVSNGAVSDALEVLQAAIDAGTAFEADTIEDLARKMSVNAARLVETVETYNGYCETGVDEEYGKPMTKVGVMDDPEHPNDFTVPQVERTFTLLNPVLEPPFYATHVFFSTYQLFQTFGGLKINKRAEVLDTSGDPIPNLYAGGENANGQVIGATYSFSGIAAGSAYIYGRIAGMSAAENALA